MKLWLISFDELGGEEHNILVAARSLNDKQAINYSVRYLRKHTQGYKYEDSDIEQIEYKEIKEVDGISQRIAQNGYYVKVGKKGFLHEWFNFTRH